MEQSSKATEQLVSARLRTMAFFFFSSRRRHTRSLRDWSSDVCSSDLGARALPDAPAERVGRCLEIDDEIRRREVADDEIEQPLVDEELVVVEIEKGVHPVALEQVVADRRLRSEERRVGKECRSGWSP